jgi:hypothetical protein
MSTNNDQASELPTLKALAAVATRLHKLGIAAWPNISIHVSPGAEVYFRMYIAERIEPFESTTIEGLEQAGRDAIDRDDSAKELREKAAKLGFDLVKKGGDQ